MAPQAAAMRGTELRRAWAELSTLVQIRRANLLLAAEYHQDATAPTCLPTRNGSPRASPTLP